MIIILYIVATDVILFPKSTLSSLYRAMDDIDAKLVPFKCINWPPS